MSDEEFDAIAARVRDRVTPSPEERERLAEITEELTDRIEAAIEDLPVEADPMLVGSAARGTWTSGDRDIDLFVRFPTELSRDRLEEYGLQIGHEVLPAGREEYAEHPYVTGTFDGFDVDVVPCYDVDDAGRIESAVDRTPFHTEYLRERLTEDLAAEVRIFKQFLKGIGIYGSDLRTRGFSGFLTELLVLEYGSARKVLEAAAKWHPPVELDPANHGDGNFDDPLVVIDPTDPDRNVAAVLSPENLARLQHHAREVLADPHEERFFPDQPDPLSADDVSEHVESRGTHPVALVFETPNLVDDDLYPQLCKSLAGIGDELDRRGFDVFRDAAFAEDRAVLLFELAVATRPAVERHVGPPVHVREHADRFVEKYEGEDVYGPFIDGERYVVERERSFVDAEEFLRSDGIFETRLGSGIERSLRSGYDVVAEDAIGELAEEFDRELAAYFRPRP